eukprot:COSAG02_NODE_3032_length_7511_cov_4.219779_6_plen_140_part_00
MTQRTGFEKIVDILLKMPGMRQNLTIFSLSNLLVFFSFFSLITVHGVNCDSSDFCGCANCMQTPPQQCLLTHGAGQFHNHVLEQCRSNDPDVDSSPDAEDEQRPSHYDERENEAEGADIDSNDMNEDIERPVVQLEGDN